MYTYGLSLISQEISNLSHCTVVIRYALSILQGIFSDEHLNIFKIFMKRYKIQHILRFELNKTMIFYYEILEFTGF